MHKRKQNFLREKKKKKKTKVSKAGQARVSKKIGLLISKEKKEPKQAAAMAYSMEKAGQLTNQGQYKKKKKKKKKIQEGLKITIKSLHEHRGCSCTNHDIHLNEAFYDQTDVFPKKRRPRRRSGPKFIVIHYTMTGSPRSTVRVLNKRGLSTHYEVDQSGNIYEYADPGSEYTWHGGKMNSYSIGIDITSGGRFSNSQINGVRKLVTELCQKFQIPQVVAPDDKKYTNITQVQKDGVGILRHRNLVNTHCPGKFPMEKLGDPAETGEEQKFDWESLIAKTSKKKLTPKEKKEKTIEFADLLGFGEFLAFDKDMSKLASMLSKASKIKSEEDIAKLLIQLMTKNVA